MRLVAVGEASLRYRVLNSLNQTNDSGVEV